MLRFCLGRAGSGKSRWIYEDIRRALHEKSVEQAILLVPEQYSFESERALTQLLGQRQEIRVYSFSRLMDMIFRAFGGFSFQNLDDVGRQIFMNLTIGDCRERLEYYRRPAAYPAFQDQMLDAVSVCKNALISPEKLLDTAALFPPDSALGQKMRDISLLYGSYEAYVAQSCLDPLDHPQRCAGLLRENLFFQNCGVWLDGFSSFSAAQLLLLGEVLGQAPQMTVALCSDSLWEDPSHQENLFAPAKETARRLIRLAREKGTEVSAPVILTGQPRYVSPALGTLEKNFYLSRPEKSTGIPSEIKVVQAANAYEEAEYTALSIRRLVREEGYRYREITLLVRQREWWPVLDAAFAGMRSRVFGMSG